MDSDDDEPMKKERKKESFTLGCEVLCQHIEFDDGEPSYIDTRKLQVEVQEAYQRVAELYAIRREYQQTIDAYEDLYNRYRHEFGLRKMYKYVSMQLCG